jgi:hypothetical protein
LGPRIQPLALVNSELESYARRGFFRSFSQTDGNDKRAEFRFFWLWNLPFHLAVDARRKTLSFKNLLPNVPVDSELNASLKALVKLRSSISKKKKEEGDPEHRQLDSKRVSVRYSNHRGQVSLIFTVAENEYQYAVQKALNLVNEIFVGVLNARFPEYVARHFRQQED